MNLTLTAVLASAANSASNVVATKTINVTLIEVPAKII